MKRRDMTAAAKFRAECATCGKRQSRATTAHTAAQWMTSHEHEHRAGTYTATNPTPTVSFETEETA